MLQVTNEACLDDATVIVIRHMQQVVLARAQNIFFHAKRFLPRHQTVPFKAQTNESAQNIPCLCKVLAVRKTSH